MKSMITIENIYKEKLVAEDPGVVREILGFYFCLYEGRLKNIRKTQTSLSNPKSKQ